MGHMIKMDPNRLNKQTFDKLWNMEGKLNYPKQIEELLQRISLKEEDFCDRNNFQE